MGLMEAYRTISWVWSTIYHLRHLAVETRTNATVPLRYLKDRTVVWGSMYRFWDNMAS